MFKFSREQIVFDIGGVKVGGQPGENPTVMIGSIFYKGDKCVQDDKTGIFDREAAKALIAELEDISSRTGLPAMLDVVCSSSENARRYLEFAADVTKMPILIDYVSEEAALSGMETARDLGIIDRTILNSINPETKSSIYEKAKEVGIRSAIALTYSSRAIISYRERIKLLETLIPRIESAGIENILVDTVVLDIATLGLACKAIFEVKERYGYPAGCGAHNAIASWKALKDKKDKILSMACSAVTNGLPIAIGADFVLYGPISDAKYMFPAISLINAAYAQILMEEGKRPAPNHPRFKISRL
ncbi:MAG: tetrahydromethanopterin S-methyltransferase subunit H [Candidatus Bathyarchaeia archaeon]|nr:tetrahydromethanopterin S-methyltransferase subunit H [Candidatus Bathyarchaeota archaeon]